MTRRSGMQMKPRKCMSTVGTYLLSSALSRIVPHCPVYVSGPLVILALAHHLNSNCPVPRHITWPRAFCPVLSSADIGGMVSS